MRTVERGIVDPDRFTELYRRHHRAIWAYAVRRLPAGTDAADVAAEVFAVAWRRRDELPAEPETLLWLYGAARRVVANATRAAGRRDRLTGRLASLRDSREPGTLPEGHPEVLAALERLGPNEREAIRLAVWEDLAVRDIAVVLDCSANAVSLRLARARKRLSRDLAHLMPAEEGTR
jgi:RNA polymerase sigma factor (sigma-70 family)